METGFGQAAKSSDRASSDSPLEIVETFWGYIICPGGRSSSRANAGETIATLTAMAFLGAAFSLWLLPSANDAVELLPFKIGLTALFFLGCGLFYSMAKKGMRFECQVDLHERALRLVRRNRGNESIAMFSAAFAGIEELKLRRSRLNVFDAELTAKSRFAVDRQVIAKGPFPLLELLSQKLQRDIQIEKQDSAKEIDAAMEVMPKRSILRKSSAS